MQLNLQKNTVMSCINYIQGHGGCLFVVEHRFINEMSAGEEREGGEKSIVLPTPPPILPAALKTPFPHLSRSSVATSVPFQAEELESQFTWTLFSSYLRILLASSGQFLPVFSALKPHISKKFSSQDAKISLQAPNFRNLAAQPHLEKKKRKVKS